MAVRKHRNDQLFVAPVEFAGPVEFGAAVTGLPGHSDPVLLGDGTVVDPTYSFTSDPDTGQFLAAPDALGFAAGGVEAMRFTEGNGSVLQAPEGNVGLTADVGSAQGDGVITSSYNVYSTVATAGDAATLPAVFEITSLIYIKNDGVQSMDVFPALGDNAGAGLNTAVAIPSGGSKTFIATVANATWTEMLVGGGGVPDPLLLGNGTAVAPTYSFTADPDTGLFRSAANVLSATVGGVARFEFNGDVFQSENVSGPAMRNVAISVTNPQFCPNQNDLNTGLGSPGQDEVSLIAGGVEGVRYVEGSGVRILASYQLDTGLTAFAGGGQASATGLGSSYNVFTVVATAGDSAVLTSLHPKGTKIFVKNNGANAMDIFPFTGDEIDTLGINVAVSLPAGKAIIFMTTTVNDTWTVMDFGITADPLLLGNGSSAAPTYSFASDPDTGFHSNGAGAILISLDAVLKWSFDVDGFTSQTANGPQLVSEAATLTNPTLIPFRGDQTTGIGADVATNTLSLVAGGVQIAQAKEVVGANQFIVAPGVIQNNPVAPSLALGDGDTGFFESVDDRLVVSTVGLARFAWSVNVFGANQAAGPAMLNEDASSTNPTLVPNQADDDTGIGRDFVDGLAFIAGGVSCMRVREIAAAPAVGLYTTTPIVQQTGVAVTAAGIHAALVNLGAFTA